ncbi:conserved hypothetical protein [Frankia canadensis]|uniref:Uncharacterized protein n=1 Tax=Frankia canadensis TaxID=1836972 RepID=A0A2I2KSH6_9ACTN|nr:conserved hypothetical protein [Frankia canadensis]SOU55905.1 conserved hypothetical protein [Frankia canadensis]
MDRAPTPRDSQGIPPRPHPDRAAKLNINRVGGQPAITPSQAAKDPG